MRIKSIEMGATYPHGYRDGAKPGMGCAVEIQTGAHYYNTTKLELPKEAVLRIAKVIAAEAHALLSIDMDAIDVEGAPGAPRPPAEDEAETVADEVAP